MAIYTDGESGCACGRTVCDYGCHTYAAKMNMRKKQTNADRIRAMTDEELAETFDLLTRTRPDSTDDMATWLEWLKQEATNELGR